MLPTWCLIGIVGIAALVHEHRMRVRAWVREAISRSGHTEKAVALDLGRAQPKLSEMIARGTVPIADLLAMPPEVRDHALMAITRFVGLPTVRDYLLEEMADRERQVLDAIRPRGAALRIGELDIKEETG
jgi:hypothetical protein